MAGKSKSKSKSKSNKATLADYIEHIAAQSHLGYSWLPAGKWHPVHGDGKSGTFGKWTSQTMKTTAEVATFKFRVQQRDLGVVCSLEFSVEPSFEQIVDGLREKIME